MGDAQRAPKPTMFRETEPFSAENGIVRIICLGEGEPDEPGGRAGRASRADGRAGRAGRTGGPGGPD